MTCASEVNSPYRAALVDGGAKAGFNIVVEALVLVLLLTPHQVSIVILVGFFFYQIKWKW